MFKPSSRLSNLPPYIFSTIAQNIRELSAQGHDVIRLDIGSPDGSPPAHVIAALARSANQPDAHGYAPYNGTPAFRQAVARFYKRRFGVVIDPDTQVLPLIGSKEGLANLCLAFLNPDDTVLIPDIGYPAYARDAWLAGANIEWLSLTARNNFLPDLQAVPLHIADRARMLWVNYPNNPTGAVADENFYQDVVNFCLKHNIMCISDNPYYDITFENQRAGSALAASGALDCGVELMSFSKSFNMGGWRLGAAVGNADILKVLLQMKSTIDTGHFRPIYDAGIAALEETSAAWGEQRNQIYRRRRDLVMEALPEAGLQGQTPPGGMYIWAQVADGDGQTYAQSALANAYVSVTPGHAFGPGGPAYIRISLGTPDDRLNVAMRRLQEWNQAKRA